MPTSGPAKTTSYLPAEELLARYPGRLANINASLALCYVRLGLAVPLSLLKSVDKSKNSQ